MIFPKQTKWRIKHKREMKLPFSPEELDENTNKSSKFCFSKGTK
jgi:hypothetical protein